MSSIHREKVRPPRQAPPDCPSVVRIATRKDENDLFDLVINGVAGELAYAPVNDTKVRALIQELTRPAVSTSRPRSVIAVIDGPEGKPIAAAPLVPATWWYSPQEWHYIQPWIYVREEHRRQPHARTLIETMVWWAEKAQVPILMTAPAKEEMFKRREVYGRYAKPFGGSFVHAGGLTKPTHKPLNTQIADLRDFVEVKELCLLLEKENGSASLFEPALDDLLGRALTHQNAIIAVVKTPEGKTVGCACLALDQWDYSLSWHYSEMWVFVHPEHRKSGYALDLINFCKWWAEQTGIPVTVGIMSKVRVKAKLRLYSRYLQPLDVFYIHDNRSGGSSGGQEVTDG